jgi:hypothetical protein
MAVLAGVGGLVAAGIADLGWPVFVALVLSSAAGVLTAIAAGIIALAAALREGERSIIVLGPLLFGAVCFLFVAGLAVSPA